MINQMYFHYVDDKSVSSFIETHSDQFKGKLKTYYNYSRVACLCDFFNILEHHGLARVSNMAVVSGTPADPELQLLNYEKLDIYDYDAATNLYDLDGNWSLGKDLKIALESFEEGGRGGYDFVLCSQVLEHIYSPLQGLKNLMLITKPRGYIWISFQQLTAYMVNLTSTQQGTIRDT